jgi:capsid protein
MERLALMSRWIDGDVFGNPIDEGMLQMIEADRCVTPTNTSKNVVHGVLLNELDRPIEFWFAKASVGKDRLQHVSRVSDTVPYSAWTEEGDPAIFHVFKAGRYSQTRGVPVFAPVFDVCGQFEDLNFAKLVQAQVVSCVGAFLEMDGAVQLGPRTDETDDDGTTKRLEKLHPGMIVKLRPGQKLSQFSPNVPNAEYFDHVRLILRLIGANIGLPLTLVLLDTHDTTFHGYRGELEQARIGFEVEQQRFPNQFNRPCNRWKIREWVRNGKLKGAVVQKMFASGEIFKHKWQAPGWPYVDPLKDANADTIIMEKMLESPRGLHARRGRDYDDVLQETVEDNGKLLSAMESKAIELNNQYPSARFTWRDVLNPRLYLFRDDEPPLQDTATDQTQPAPRRKSTESPSKNGAHRFQEALS